MSATSESLGTPATSPHPRRWRALGLLAVANLMLILDVTVVAVAMPQLGADLGMSRDALTWVMSGYTLAFGGLMLTGGRLADLDTHVEVALATQGKYARFTFCLQGRVGQQCSQRSQQQADCRGTFVHAHEVLR